MPANPQSARKAWWENYAATAAFVATHGRLPRQRETCRVGDKDIAVGRWLMHQRQRGKLDDEQQAALDALLSGHPVTRDDAWLHHRNLVAAYVAETGHLPVKGTVWRDAPIGQWTRDQRKAFHRGALSAERVASLEAIPGWQWSPEDADFERGFTHFLDFVAEHHTGWVPVHYVCADGFALGSWSRDRRRHRDTEPGHRVQRLLAAGFVYDTPAPADRPKIPAQADPLPASRHARGSADAWQRRRDAEATSRPR